MATATPTFYIESGSGAKVTDQSQFQAGKSYIESNTGNTFQGPPTATTHPATPTPTPGTQPFVPLGTAQPDNTLTTPTVPGVTAAGALPTTPATPAAPAATTPAATPYTGVSVVDYLNHLGQPSDFVSRSAKATSMGIQNYTGTAAQNTQMLNSLRTAAPAQTGGTSGGTSSGSASGASTGGTSGSATDTGDKATDPYAGLDPVSKQVKMYQDASTSLGLPTIKQQYEDTIKQQKDLQDELNGKLADIQNNPWLSQGIVDRTQAQLKDKYQSRLDTLTHLATLYDSMYQQGVSQVDKIVSGADADIKATNDLAQKQLDAANAIAKDNQVVSIGGREQLRNKVTGKLVADLGPTTKSATTGSTLQERNQSALNQISSLFTVGPTVPGTPAGADGKRVPYLDSEGYATPEGWKVAVAAAGLPRADFIKQFAYLITTPQGTISSKYGLTPAEQKLALGTGSFGLPYGQ